MPHTTLVSATELLQNVARSDWVVVDCRHDLTNPEAGRAAFDTGHIPGARFASMDAELSSHTRAPDGSFRGRHPLPERAAFVATLRSWGINGDSQVVAYDAQGGMYAARLWWMLRWVGHEGSAVLDGGLPAWVAAGGGLSTDIAKPATGSIEEGKPLVPQVDAAVLLANLSEPRKIVIDARAPDRFRGENETMDPVGGHIPGARNFCFKNNLDPRQHFRSPEELRADYEELIASPETTVLQCGSGVTACHNLLAMEIAGLSGAALYPGSWSEWCSDPGRPVAIGD
ncbi:MAG: sulfurtransferase [Herminiimonas sp.]|nr:sulfurtransferase [Herminiimonas sp.]MDB5855260.1 sulfurtransferase [Herminiimonas sp.]